MDQVPLTELLTLLGLVVVPGLFVGVAGYVGYRAGFNSILDPALNTDSSALLRLPSLAPHRITPLQASRATVNDTDSHEPGSRWSRFGLWLSILLLVLALVGFGVYYVTIQTIEPVGSNLPDSAANVDNGELTDIERARLALTAPDTSTVDVGNTKDWKTYQEAGYSFLYPPTFTIGNWDAPTRPEPVPGQSASELVSSLAIQSPDEAAKTYPIYLVISKYTNTAVLEPGAFSSLYPLHQMQGKQQRSAFYINSYPSTKFVVTNDTERVETTYITKLGSDAMYTLSLRGSATSDTEHSTTWETYKTIISKLKFE